MARDVPADAQFKALRLSHRFSARMLPLVTCALGVVAGSYALIAVPGVAASDTEGPTITNVLVSPTTVAAGDSFSISFDLSDPSGIGDQAGRAHWLLGGTEQALIYRCYSNGGPTSLHCSGSIEVPGGAASGIYTPIDFRAWDQLNNETLAAERLPSINVTGGSAPTATPTTIPTGAPTATGTATATPVLAPTATPTVTATGTSAAAPVATASHTPTQSCPSPRGPTSSFGRLQHSQ